MWFEHSFIPGVVDCNKWLWTVERGSASRDSPTPNTEGSLPTVYHTTTNRPHFTNGIAPLRSTPQGDHFKRLFERRSGFQDACRIARFFPRALEAARQPGRYLEPARAHSLRTLHLRANLFLLPHFSPANSLTEEFVSPSFFKGRNAARTA